MHAPGQSRVIGTALRIEDCYLDFTYRNAHHYGLNSVPSPSWVQAGLEPTSRARARLEPAPTRLRIGSMRRCSGIEETLRYDLDRCS